MTPIIIAVAINIVTVLLGACIVGVICGAICRVRNWLKGEW